MLSLETTCTREDIYDAVLNYFEEKELNWNNLTECNVHGCNAMMGRNVGSADDC